MNTKQRQLVVVGIGGFAVAASLLMLVQALRGAKPGDPCRTTTDCQLGLVCLMQRCLTPCELDDDCPRDLRCGVVNRKPDEYGQQGGPVLVCLASDDVQRQVQQSVSIKNSKQAALAQRRAETYDALQVLLTEETWAVSDETFDEAWEELPVALRRGKAPEDLAKLIMTTAGTPKVKGRLKKPGSREGGPVGTSTSF